MKRSYSHTRSQAAPREAATHLQNVLGAALWLDDNHLQDGMYAEAILEYGQAWAGAQ
jgi:hypothetical protein